MQHPLGAAWWGTPPPTRSGTLRAQIAEDADETLGGLEAAMTRRVETILGFMSERVHRTGLNYRPPIDAPRTGRELAPTP